MLRALALLVVVLITVPAAGAPEPPATNDPMDAAVAKALAFLHKSQERDGAWSAAGNKNAAITALSVMAFLSAGHVPGEGRYGATVDKGIRWVLAAQHPSGIIATEDNHHEAQMYHHGICTLMLAEVAGMTGDKQGAEVRRALEKAVEVILLAQRTTGLHEGGWRYVVDKDDGDISVVGWQLLALRAAKNLGCDVPAERIDRAVQYVLRCWNPVSGAFNYYPPNFRPSVACTGTGILSLEICGKQMHGSRQCLAAGEVLLNDPPRWGGPRFFYSVYYCSQATFQLGGDYWKKYRPLLHNALLPYQNRDGSWRGLANEDNHYGANYGTAMAVLSLTVQYRLLPIYQSGEDHHPGK
jgi:hypothetical protein